MNVPGRAAILASLLSLAGCTTVSAPPAAPPAPEPPKAVEPPPCPQVEAPAVITPVPAEPPGAVRALAYFNRSRERPARELRGEYESVRKAYAASRSEHDRMRLAMLLSLPHTGFDDETQALDLLDPLARDAGSEYQALAQLMTSLLNEQRRASRQAAALQQKLDRIRALEKEMQQRTVPPEPRKR